MLKTDKVFQEYINGLVNSLFEQTRGRIDLAEEELRKKGIEPSNEMILAYFTGLNYGLDRVKNTFNVKPRAREYEITEQVVAK